MSADAGKVFEDASAVSSRVTICNAKGLHARASATLVRVASRFRAEVTISKDGHAVNGKSILGMMTLAAAKGSSIAVTATGDDQEAALAAIGQCIADKFGEE